MATSVSAVPVAQTTTVYSSGVCLEQGSFKMSNFKSSLARNICFHITTNHCTVIVVNFWILLIDQGVKMMRKWVSKRI